MPSPIILALETSTACGSAALIADNQCLAEYSLISKLTHSKRVLNGIELIMQNSGISWSQLDAIAVSLGPGSFTGLRIALSTAKGLAMAADKPLVGIPTLDALASQFAYSQHLICPLLDARKQEIYTALYRSDQNSLPARISNYLNITLAALVNKISEPTIFTGDGVRVYGNFLKEQLGTLAIIAPATIYFPRAATIGQAAVSQWQKQNFLVTAEAVPIYIRVSDAELKFKNIIRQKQA